MPTMLENAVVGAVITNPDLVPTVLAKVSPADLWEPKAGSVLTAVADLWATGTPIDAVGVVGHLSKAGSQVSAGDVFAMMEQACLPNSLPHHLETIADRAAVRRLSNAGQRIVTMAQQGDSPQAIAQKADEMLHQAVRADDSKTRKVSDTIGDTLDAMRRTAAGEDQAGLPTGLYDLDDLTNGLHGGQMVIIAARPGLGKTTLAADFLRHATMREGKPALMFSLEMSANELNQRMIAAESSVSLSKILTGQLSEQEWTSVEDAAGRLAEAPLWVDDSDGITMMDIVAKSKLLVEQHGVGLIVVDYLQLLRSQDRMESREQEIATYSRQMKMLARSCDVPVVVVAQLNREAVRLGRAPVVSDLRESGALEQDADVILLIDRPEAMDENSARAGEADIIVGKNRRGRTGTVTVASQLHYGRFSNMHRGV